MCAVAAIVTITIDDVAVSASFTLYCFCCRFCHIHFLNFSFLRLCMRTCKKLLLSRGAAIRNERVVRECDCELSATNKGYSFVCVYLDKSKSHIAYSTHAICTV